MMLVSSMLAPFPSDSPAQVAAAEAVARETARLAHQTALGRSARRVARMTKGDSAIDAPPVAVPARLTREEADAIDADAFLAMGDRIYATAYAMARRSAAKGRYVGSIAIGAPVPLPSPLAVEDDETATDAVGTVWAMVANGKPVSSPLRLVCAVARRLGQRRAQHRLRERSGLTDAPTDTMLPSTLEGRTVAELLAMVHPSKRGAMAQAIASKGDRATRQRVNRLPSIPAPSGSIPAEGGGWIDPVAVARNDALEHSIG